MTMRYLPLLLFALSGCGMDAPIAAAPPSKDTIVAALERYDALSVARDEAQAGKLDTLTETVGNLTSEVEGVKEELRANRASIDALSKLLTVSESPSTNVPQVAPVPAPVDAPPVESAGKRLAGGVMLNGEPLDVDGVIRAHWRREWTYPGLVSDHLKEHGVSGFEGLDLNTQVKLHSALHEMEVAGKTKAVVKERTVIRAAAPVQSCPNGQCPTAGRYYYPQQTQRWSLFGGRRR